MPKLRHFELEERAFPRHKLALPKECKLLTKLHGYRIEFSWEAYMNSTSPLPEVLFLGMSALQAWPATFGFFCLNFLVLEVGLSTEMYPLFDLAVLKDIDHVRLISHSFLEVALTEGCWQSLEIISERGLWVDFSDMDAFITDTKLFSFCYSYVDVQALATSPHMRMCAEMVDRIEATCGKHAMECYKTSHRVGGWGMLMRVAKISNRKLKPPFDTWEVLRPSEPALWQLAEPNLLAPSFWPEDPCKSLSGMRKR